MEIDNIKTLNLNSLSSGIPVISDKAMGFYEENCMLCFYHGGHMNGVKLRVKYQHTNHIFAVYWSGEITEQLVKNYGDLSKSTDHAACAIALLLVRELTEYVAVEQSAIGTTVDYFLAAKKDDVLIFNNAARLEVSGILRENEGNTVEGRIRRKIRRLADNSLPTFIVVVEFSQPWSTMVRHE